MSSGAVRTSNQKRASTKITIVFVAILLAGFFGYRLWSEASVGNLNFAPISPTRVNLVGIDTSKGFYIIVANGIAQVIEGSIGEFEANMDDPEGDRKRIPIKEMLQAMQGNEDATSRFAMAMNDIKEEDLPNRRVYWEADDVQKALDGDPELTQKLERDLNTKLDGSPLAELRPAVLDTGIVVKVPVKITVPAPEGAKEVTATVLRPFQSKFMIKVFKELSEKPQVTRELMAGYYAQIAIDLKENPKSRQKVGEALKELITEQERADLAERAEKVVNSMQVLINGTHITDARYEAVETPRGTMYDITLQLTDEGRKRLWKYSKGKVGSQILLTVDGVALAAPKIGSELSQTELTIKQILLDERFVKDAVDAIKEEATK